MMQDSIGATQEIMIVNRPDYTDGLDSAESKPMQSEKTSDGNAGYVIPVFDLSDNTLLNTITLIEEKRDNLRNWNDNSTIINYIDSKIQLWFSMIKEKQND